MVVILGHSVQRPCEARFPGLEIGARTGSVRENVTFARTSIALMSAPTTGRMEAVGPVQVGRRLELVPFKAEAVAGEAAGQLTPKGTSTLPERWLVAGRGAGGSGSQSWIGGGIHHASGWKVTC